MTRLLLLLSIIGLSACQSVDTSGESQKTPTTLPAPPTGDVDEDALFLELSKHLYSNPVEPAMEHQNAIIDYALDKKLDVRPTGSGLFMWIIEPGEGAALRNNMDITAHYKGQLLDGTIVDSSIERGAPLSFKPGQMIFGWQEALKQLKVGGHAILLMPPALAYGEEGLQGPNGKTTIPPNAPMRFDLIILDAQ
ncbi:MAG: hypothetical protein GYB31_14475 [Bacteroidetes bacterium]|nr:hypothetical protein [Bacteroidota bacterium]